MKCDRCGKKMLYEYVMGSLVLCDDCLTEFREFMGGAKLCKCNQAYFTVMFEEI